MATAAAVKHRQEQARLVRTYQEFCEEHAFNPCSPTLVSVGAFLVIRTRSLQGSSKTIRAVSGAIRRHCVLNSVPYLTADEQLIAGGSGEGTRNRGYKEYTSSEALVPLDAGFAI
jgi:hypothetical protein